MFGIEVELLTGSYVATAHNDRSAAEWPPHPARLFSALVATWADAESPDADEREALKWLEQAGDPEIRASDATPRSPVTHYVRTNDATIFGRSLLEGRATKVDQAAEALDAALEAAGGDTSNKTVEKALASLAKNRDVAQQVTAVGNTPPASATALLPEGRGRQPRFFPSVTPTEPQIEFLWPEATPDPRTAEALDGLLARVVRLGHSSSFVACRITAGDSTPAWLPSGEGDALLRNVGSGQLAALEAAYGRHLGSRPRTLPAKGVYYTSPATTRPSAKADARTSNLSGRWFVFEFLPPRRLPIWRAVDVAEALRDTLMSFAPTIPEALSGHRNDGLPSTDPHAAFAALPFVGRQHATGRLIGAAVLEPSSAVPDAGGAALHDAIIRAVGAWEDGTEEPALLLGRAGRICLRRVRDEASLVTLGRYSWEGPSHAWASVTPVALPQHPGSLSRGSVEKRQRAWSKAEDLVRLCCDHVGLPEPSRVTVGMQPLVQGVPPARAFPVFHQFDRGQQRDIVRLQVHTMIEFDEPVRGPLLLGAGRYFGLGLMLPLDGRARRA